MSAVVLGVERSMAGRRWTPRLDAAGDRRALAIMQTHGLPDFLARVLASRSIDAAGCQAYLAPSLRSLMPDPDVLTGLPAAVERLEAAIRRRETVAIIGDYDVDGAASTALLVGYLEAAGARCRFHIPDRVREGYGPNSDAVRRLAAADATLLVTLDCGSSAHEPLAEAGRLGLDAIVLDHHGIEHPFPRALAIVNPKRPDDLSGLEGLCAAGIVFMVLAGLQRALRRSGFWTGREAPDLLAGLDLVALATVADVVPLTGLNRAFVDRGLKVMRRRERPGLAALSDVAELDGPPSVFHLGFVIGPRINAGGRIGDAMLGARLLLARDAEEGRPLAAELDRLNRERRVIEAAAVEEAQALADLVSTGDGAVLVAAGEDWHPGVVGLVAARLRERFGRPSFAIALRDGQGVGSGRSVPGVDLGLLVREAVGRGLLLKGGGHAMAAGVTIEAAKIDAFRTYLAEAAAGHVGAGTLDALAIDAALAGAAATPALVAELDRAGPFGAGSPEPVVALADQRVADLAVVGDGHLRVGLVGGDGARIKAMAFRAVPTPLADALGATRGRLVHCAGTLALGRAGFGAPRAELRLLDAALATIDR